MLATPLIKPPFFEIGPKSYLYGGEILELAQAAERASEKYQVQIIFTAPLTSISTLAQMTKRLLITAPHMDPLYPGRGLAEVLPEAVKAAGAAGVMLNHAEKPLSFAVLEKTLRRAEEVGLFTIVCASSIAEIKAVAQLAPDVLVAEPTELIGTGKSSDLSYVQKSIDSVRSINEKILVLQGAGISSGEDVYKVIASGADASGSSSAIVNAADRFGMVEEMIAAVRRAWDERSQRLK